MNYKWLIGIDEAGRGPLAGPVAVGLVLVPADFDWKLIPGVNDSKQLSEKKREAIYARALELASEGRLQYLVEMPTAKAIDKKGIAVVIKEAVASGLQTVLSRHNQHEPVRSKGALSFSDVLVKLDGGLRAPAEFVLQETIIKGDAKEKVIGLASIMAKVTRDRYMEKIATKPAFSMYEFARHKGYGTAAHRQAIAEHGVSVEHRVSYCQNCLNLQNK